MDYFNTSLHETQQRYLRRQLELLIDLLSPEDERHHIEYKQVALVDGKTAQSPIHIQLSRCPTPAGWAYRITERYDSCGQVRTGSGWYSQDRGETIERMMSLICFKHGKDKEAVRAKLAAIANLRPPNPNQDFLLVLISAPSAAASILDEKVKS